MAPLGNPDELSAIIRQVNLSSVFQPIVDLQKLQVLGYEALIRGPATTVFHNPLVLFDTAGRHGMMAELEYVCREVCCSSFVGSNADGKLFINISPMSLTDSGYHLGSTQRIIDRVGLPADRIVIELSEQYPLDDYDLLRRATDHFRQEGFQIAIDDLGAGYAGLRAWSELQPDFVKIDRHFIEHIHRDPVKQEFVRSIQEIANELNCQVVAEGIETSEEMNTVQELGLQFGQGYFLGRPEFTPETEALVVERIRAVSTSAKRLHRKSQTVEEMTLGSPCIAPNLALTAVSELFQENRGLSCLPVVDGSTPIGIVDRHDFLELFSLRYGRELHGRKPIREFMNTSPYQFCHDMTLEEVSRLLTDNEPDRLIQDFIVIKDGKYFGTGQTSTLLKRITDLQIRNARYANPLTLLPGNVPLHEKLDELLRNESNFRVAYFDLDSFKPFNDLYGYSRGDDVIFLLSRLLVENVDPEVDFVTHVGGDDFVVIFESPDWESTCHRILTQFSEAVPRFYNESALDEGGIWGLSRNGEEQFYQLLSVSIGVANPDSAACSSFHDISALAVEAKKQAKREPGNSLFVSRRRRPSPSAQENRKPLQRVG